MRGSYLNEGWIVYRMKSVGANFFLCKHALFH